MANLSVIRRSGPRKRLPTCCHDGVRHGRHARKADRFNARIYFCVVASIYAAFVAARQAQANARIAQHLKDLGLEVRRQAIKN